MGDSAHTRRVRRIHQTRTVGRLPRAPGAVAALLAALLAAPSAAVEGDGADRFDRVRLEASAEAAVETDRLRARLYKEVEATAQAAAADAVNRAVTGALEQARAAGVDVRTAGYRTQPVYRERQIVGWRVRQDLVLETADAERLASLLGDLQRELSVQSLEQVLSADARRMAEDGLITQALDAFRHRADLIARSLGRTGWRIVTLEVNASRDGGPTPRAMLRTAEMASATVAPPSIEGGRLAVTVRVGGTIELAAPGGG